MLDSWWGTENLSEFYSKNKFEELVHIVGFITRIVELSELGSVPWRWWTLAVVSELLSTYSSGSFIWQFWLRSKPSRSFRPIENAFGLILRHVEMYSGRRCVNLRVNLQTLLLQLFKRATQTNVAVMTKLFGSWRFVRDADILVCWVFNPVSATIH